MYIGIEQRVAKTIFDIKKAGVKAYFKISHKDDTGATYSIWVENQLSVVTKDTSVFYQYENHIKFLANMFNEVEIEA